MAFIFLFLIGAACSIGQSKKMKYGEITLPRETGAVKVKLGQLDRALGV